MRNFLQGERRSVDRGTCGPGIQPRKKIAPGRRRCKEKRKAPSGASISRDAVESRAVRDPGHVRKRLAREPGGPVLARRRWSGGTRREVQGRTPTMNEHRKSDGPIVPLKSPNKAGQPAAEEMEGRGPAKGNLPQQNAPRTQRRESAPSALERVRLAAARDRKMRFTALLHHVYALPTLRAAYLNLKREAAAGVDGETWRHYGERLEENLRDLADRVKRGAYRAKPVRRVYIPKTDGRQRPLGVTALEDKLLQRATIEVLNAIYQTDFLGFSYGFRPGRSPHHALDALYAGLLTRKVKWVLDLDIRGFFDRVNHDLLMGRLARRIGDSRLLRLIRRYLNAGMMVNGVVMERYEGTPQGVLSPLLANLLLDEVDKQLERRGHAFVRYADDLNVYVRTQRSGERVMASLRKQFGKLKLRVNEAKSKVRRATASKFLGFSFWVAAGRTIRRRVDIQAIKRMKESEREMTR